MELVPTKELNSKILIIFLQICLDVNKDVIVKMEKSNVKMLAGKKSLISDKKKFFFKLKLSKTNIKHKSFYFCIYGFHRNKEFSFCFNFWFFAEKWWTKNEKKIIFFHFLPIFYQTFTIFDEMQF